MMTITLTYGAVYTVYAAKMIGNTYLVNVLAPLTVDMTDQ